MCYHAKFGCSALKGADINIAEPPKLISAGIPQAVMVWEAWLTPRYTFPPRVTTSNLVVLRQRVVNASLAQGRLPLSQRHAIVTPLLKKQA